MYLKQTDDPCVSSISPGMEFDMYPGFVNITGRQSLHLCHQTNNTTKKKKKIEAQADIKAIWWKIFCKCFPTPDALLLPLCCFGRASAL